MRSIKFDKLAHSAERPDPRTRPTAAQTEPVASSVPTAAPSASATPPAPPAPARSAQLLGK